MKKSTLLESNQSDYIAFAGDSATFEEFLSKVKENGLEGEFTEEELEDFYNSNKSVTEKKATYCGRCGHTHVKGTPCPRPFKEGLSTYGDDAYFVVPNKGKMKKEDIVKAIKEILAEATVEITTTDGTEATATPDQKEQIRNARTKGTSITFRKRGDTKPLEEDDHQDPNDESDMAKTQLYATAKYAIELLKMIQDGTQLDAWVQSKITKAADYIDSVKHYMEGEMYLAGTDEVEEGNLGHNELASLEKEGGSWIVTYRTMDGKKEKVFTDEDEARTFMGTVSEAKKELDPVGHEDKDIDNDGDVDKTDKYLKNKRVKIGQAIAQHKKK